MKRRGYMMMALALAALLFLLGALTMNQVEMIRLRARRQAQQLQARSLAESGCRYARFRLQSGSWRGPSFRSPELQGSFHLQVSPLPGGRFRIVSAGRAGTVTHTLVETYP
jgi:hypothetical protein